MLVGVKLHHNACLKSLVLQCSFKQAYLSSMSSGSQHFWTGSPHNNSPTPISPSTRCIPPTAPSSPFVGWVGLEGVMRTSRSACNNPFLTDPSDT
uniref:Ovule protein n=1 Tax=Mesocestoides corti TaxID=53468 RepID=A0A5K3G3Z5_MESCO